MRVLHLLTTAMLAVSVAFSCDPEEPVNPTAGANKKDYITSGTSALSLPYVMSSRMVLLQNSTVNIFGFANSGVKVTVSPSWTKDTYEQIVPASGRWVIPVSTPKGSFTEYTITISDSQKGKKILYQVLIGEVWMTAGQSNMEHPMRGFGTVAAGNYQPILNAEAEMQSTDIPSFRYFKDKYQLSQTPMTNTKESSWDQCVYGKSAEFEAMAFFFGRYLSRKLNVPVGIIGCAYGGSRIESWLSPEVLAKFNKTDYSGASTDPTNKSYPSNIHYGMVLPVMDYTIRGWLWYQGESNRDNANVYARMQAEMVAEWRSRKGDLKNELPFYYMQIAPFKSADDESGAVLRDFQMQALSMIPNSGISCASDVGDYSTIHYPNKKVPAERIALWAMYNQYSDKSVNPMGPAFKSIRAEGDKLIVSLSNAEGLHYASGVSNASFSRIIGADGTSAIATVKILSDGSLEFSASSVSAPVSAQYCYNTWHVGTIFNGAGLPLFPFKASIK